MTPFARLLRKLTQKVAGAWYDGPEPPKRFAAVALDFANLHPEATRRQWLEFAVRFAEGCYREGFTRGYEAAERDPAPEYTRLPPELLMNEVDPDWKWSPAFGTELADPDNRVDEIDAAPIDLRAHERSEGGKVRSRRHSDGKHRGEDRGATGGGVAPHEGEQDE